MRLPSTVFETAASAFPPLRLVAVVSIAFGWGARNGWITGRRISNQDPAFGLSVGPVGLVVVDGAAGERHDVAIGDPV